MRTPVVSSRVTFMRPFMLRGLPNLNAPGTYSIETTEKHHWSFPFSWETEARTMIRVAHGFGLDGGLFKFEVCPRDLFAAMERDRLHVVSPPSDAKPA